MTYTYDKSLNPLHFNVLWHYEGGTPSRRSFCLFWRETKQRPGLEISDETGSGVGKAGLRETRRPAGRRNPQKAVCDERRREQLGVDTGQQRDQSAWDRVLVARGNFTKNYTSVIVCRGIRKEECHNLPFLHLSWPKPYCSFVLFFLTPLIVFLVAIEKCAIPLQEPLDDHQPRRKCFEKVDVFQGPRGYCLIMTLLNNSWKFIDFDNSFFDRFHFQNGRV